MFTKIKGCLKNINFKQVLGQRIIILTSLVLTLAIVIAVGFSQIKTVVIADGDNSYTVRTLGNNTNAILAQVGIKVSNDDKVTAGNSSITIKRAFSVFVKANGVVGELKMTEGTVRQALLDDCVTVADSDIVNYDLDEPVFEGMEIEVTKISYSYNTKTKNTADGKVKITYRNKLVNGELTETKVVKKKVIKKKRKSVNRKVRASKIAAVKSAKTSGVVSELKASSKLKLNKKGLPEKYKKVITGKATAYYNKYNRHCATGVKPRPGYIAVDPREIPYGTEMYIVSNDGRYVYGYAIAADTGGFAHNSSTVCDLFFNTASECRQFGRRNVTIYILG